MGAARQRAQRARKNGVALVAMLSGFALAAAACNALNGGHDRVLDSDDSSVVQPRIPRSTPAPRIR